MGKRRKKRRGRIRRAVRAATRGLLAAGILTAIVVVVAAGSPAWGFVALPISMMALVILVPVLLFVLAVFALSLALPVAILTGIFGGPLILLHRILRGNQRDTEEDAAEDAQLPAATVLRRRYVAGELSYPEFQSGMLGVLKEQFARGQLKLSEYEAELERLLAPARHLDAHRDPALAARVS